MYIVYKCAFGLSLTVYVCLSQRWDCQTWELYVKGIGRASSRTSRLYSVNIVSSMTPIYTCLRLSHALSLTHVYLNSTPSLPNHLNYRTFNESWGCTASGSKSRPKSKGGYIAESWALIGKPTSGPLWMWVEYITNLLSDWDLDSRR